jgi:hypothetical protein
MSLASSKFFKQFFSLQFLELLFTFIVTSYMHCGILVLSILQSLFYNYVTLSSGLAFSHFFFLVLWHFLTLVVLLLTLLVLSLVLLTLLPWWHHVFTVFLVAFHAFYFLFDFVCTLCSFYFCLIPCRWGQGLFNCFYVFILGILWLQLYNFSHFSYSFVLFHCAFQFI